MTERRCLQLVRTWHLIALLRSAPGCTLERLSRELGVTTRTIRRDLEALQSAGIAIYDVRNEDDSVRRWRLMKGAPCAICGRGLATGKEYREACAS